ncbi:MAG: hypothetical protein ABI700_24060 [Chloroflexota bacterium]
MKTYKLHEAMELVLRDHNKQWMNASDLADEINSRALYRKKDGSLLKGEQIRIRAYSYSHMFERDGAMVRLL